ncbi:MAG: hypothetical protein HRU18_14155 [Pseudoalteromonas sp.]|uniref:P22 phage major capsid protein family protein n=1 Tax=Pseudoalteromonas sp. TaxID=53249 RepID=UPI001DCA3EDB|nr:P22 phage major capsid protein family protein [Pseudoalteromonas sp.]NRA79347.1 hypothetical protein [Pseudoalteromonas sp.]
MPNNFDSNITRKLTRVFLEKMETSRVLSKSVNTSLLSNVFNPSTGDTVDYKRPTDYKSSRTSDGDISSTTASPIITGKASAVVQDYITVEVDFLEAKQALEMDQLDQLLAPAVTRIKTDLELDFAKFVMRNTALVAGNVGTAVSTWDHIAEAGSIMESSGVPMDSDWFYFVNPFTQRKLASTNRALGAGGVAGGLVKTATDKATIASDFAGMSVLTASTLANYNTQVGADRTGTLTADPDATYLTAKDSMKQTLAVTAMQANLVVKAGETITIAGRNRLNLSTREVILDDTGAPVLWSATVAADVTLGASGEGNIIVTGPAIFEATGAYNTVDSAPLSGDVVTLLGAASTIIQPNLFWHKQAFGIGFVPIEKLFSTDTVGTTEDGLQVRVSKGASIRENKQIIRFDIRPAYAALNPFLAGQGFGS